MLFSMRKFTLLFLFVSLLFSLDSFAAKRYWIASSAAYWNNTANWSSSSGGAGGSSVPTSSDTAYFDGNGLGNDTLDANVNVKRISIAAGYTGTFVQGSYSITIGSAGATLSGGTFSGEAGSITSSGIFTISGCAFTSTSGTLSVAGNLTISSGSFSHNNGTVALTATSALTVSVTGGITFYVLNFAPSAANGTYTITSTTTINVSSALNYQSSYQVRLNTGTIHVQGNISTASNSVANTAGSATLIIDGTTNQTIVGNSTGGDGRLPNIEVNKSADTLSFYGVISVEGNWTHTAGIVNERTAVFTFYGTVTFSGGPTFYTAWLATGGTYTISGDTLTIDHLLAYGGGAANCPVINSGTISVLGDLDLSYCTNTGGSGGTGTLLINGTSDQTITGSVLGSGKICNLTINKSSGTLYMSGYISAMKDWTYNSGTISAGTSTLVLAGSQTVTGSHTLSNVWFGSSATHTIASGTTLTITGLISYGTSAGAVLINTGTINCTGDINLANPTAGGGGTATIIINGTGTQTITGNATQGISALPNVTINKASGTLNLADKITVAGNWTYITGTISAGSSKVVFHNTKTITGSHTLGDVIFTGSTSATFTVSSGTTLTVAGTLTLGSSYGITINTGTINAKGDILTTNTTASGGGSANIIINGSGSQSLTGTDTYNQGYFCNVEIDKSPSDTLHLLNKISIAGNWTYTAGIIDAGSSAIYFVNAKTISGSHTLYNVYFAGSTPSTFTISSGTTITVLGTMFIGGTTNALTFNTGTINAHGNINVINNTATGGGGSATININGNGNQTLTGSGTASQGRLPKIVIDKTSGTLLINGLVSVANDWTFIQGDVDPGTSSVAFYGTMNLDGQNDTTFETMRFYRLAVGSGTLTITDNVDVDNDLTIASGTTLVASSDTIYVGGQWNSQGTWTRGTSTVIFDGTGYKQLTGLTGSTINFYNLGFNKTANSMTLSRPVKVNHAMILTQGHIISSSTNYLEFANDATVTGGSDTAYVCGPVRKTGDDAFTFPLGDTTLTDSSAYHPLGMTAPSSTTDQFEARYYAVGQTVGDSLVDSLASVSADEYWTFERKAGTSDVVTTLGWNKNSMSIQDLNVLRMASWNGVKWLDLDIDSISVNTRMGTFIPLLTPVFNSGIATLTFANKRASVPYALLKKKLDGGYYQAKNGRLFFRFDEEYTDTDQKLHFNIYDDQHVLVTSDQLQPASIQPTVHYGDNRYQMNTLFCGFSPGGALDSGFYILEVINEKNEHWYLRFEQFYDINLVTCYDQPSED